MGLGKAQDAEVVGRLARGGDNFIGVGRDAQHAAQD